ncbi:hypothetical protein FACS1894111_11650 [Clostridia bacterium]|nr:hypothetical protein FACS1894111_11650 [Clostridia bacterium]
MANYTIAKYIRLSMDDAITESMSIPHQHLMLDAHIDCLEIPNAEILEFVDNGHSGTNMERPAVQELIELVRSGRINCIVVKDFSRFSRNAMDSGYFIEQVFPLYGVRFIAVSDDFDSDNYKGDTGGIDVAFKFLMHEYYSQDLSKKVKSAKRIQMMRGENIGSHAIYGYHKNALGKWELDPETAEIVRRIFQMKIGGMSTGQIRDLLAAEKQLTPSRYLARFHQLDTLQSNMWTADMVLMILKREQYTGTYIAGRREVKEVGSYKKIYKPKEDWIIIPGSHPPIISKEDFTKAQESLEKYKSCRTSKPISLSCQEETNRSEKSRLADSKRIVSSPIYGYRKLENSDLEIDETAASVVREIFDLALQELPYFEIRDIISTKSYPTPSEYIKQGNGHAITPTCQWATSSIRKMLQNEQFIGTRISGKFKKNPETGKRDYTLKSDWIVIPDRYPAIISKEVFAKVQEIIADNKANGKQIRKKDYLLRGKAVCGCCGYKLKYDDASTTTIVYRCLHSYADPNAKCHKMKISAAEIHETVLAIIKKQAELVLNTDKLSNIQNNGADAGKTLAYEKQLRQLEEECQKFYEQFVLCEIDRETYQSVKSDCAEQIEQLHKQLAVLRQTERKKRITKQSLAMAKKAMDESAIPQGLVEALIEKVLVFPDNRLEIRWKVADFMEYV